MTAVAYQGLGSLDGVLALAGRSGKGVFVLAATSNPEAFATQTARRADGVSVAAGVVADVAAHNAAARAEGGGSVGVVIGATVALSDFGLSPASLADLPVLAPGFGHQGARIDHLPGLFGDAAQNVVVSASRSILSTGPSGIEAAIDAAAAEAEAACRA